jgi:hypothetical protein
MNPQINQDAAFDPNGILTRTDRTYAVTGTVLSGNSVVAGEVLGRVALDVSATASADGGNTGDGTFGAVTVNEDAILGDYIVEIIEADTDAGNFKVIDPNGNRLDDGVVGTAYSNDHLGFTLADGAADFVVGDKWTITVEAGSLKYKRSLTAATDGSNVAVAIAGEAIDASAADAAGVIYLAGDFDERQLTFGTGHSADSLRHAFAARGIFLHPSDA